MVVIVSGPGLALARAAAPQKAARAAAPQITASADPPTETTVVADPTPITLSPTIAATPKLQLTSANTVNHAVKLQLACTFAACQVTARLTTLEHLRSGRATGLTALGAGRDTRTVVIGSLKPMKVLPGATVTVSVPLNSSGLGLLDSFRSVPVSATIVLTNASPVARLHRVLEITAP